MDGHGPGGDFYEDALEQVFDREEYLVTEHVDVFEDAICDINDGIQTKQSVCRPPSVNNQNSIPAVTNGASINKNSSNITTAGCRYELYVSNLTWRTTPQDIKDSVTKLGVLDLMDVKIFEHRENGQSKSICIVTLGSEHSLQLVKDGLPKYELYGQSPVVTFPTKQTLVQIE